MKGSFGVECSRFRVRIAGLIIVAMLFSTINVASVGSSSSGPGEVASRKDAKSQRGEVETRGHGDAGTRRGGDREKGSRGSESITSTHTFTNSPSSSDLVPTPGLIHTFSNPAPINLPVNAPTGLYPSVINVSNIPTQLSKVTVTLNAVNHTFPSDLDILLVGPQGQTAVIMSDAGGSTDLENVNITLDDEAAIPIPELIAITTGIYRPTNSTSGGLDSWPPPAPAAPSVSSSFSPFTNTNPNGEWRLFALDDVGFVDGGSIAMGWTLNITSAFSGQNSNAISIPDNGMAAPYPSEINITGHDAPISFVRVNILNLSHTSPDDVDILLASPDGRAVMLMSDVGGGGAVSNVSLTFDDMTVSTLPDNGPLFGGTYRPANFEPGDSFPSPAPQPTGTKLSSFNGSTANGTWKLFIVDDSGNNVGNISGGWMILVGTAEGSVSFQGAGVASPYPSEINVTGVLGNTTRVNVTIANFSHTVPDDVDILLAGPDGRNIVLMSDAGGATEIGGLTFNFDDVAATQLPDNGPLTSGGFRPTDYEPGEVFPSPAPPGGPTGTGLQAFYGGVPNGVWRLFVRNDNSGSIGSLAAMWSLQIEASPTACLMNVSPSVQAFPVGGGTGSFGITQTSGCLWTASTSGAFISIHSSTSGGGDGSISFSVAPNQGPPRTGSIDVTNGVQTRSFQVQQASGCPFTIGQSTVNFTAAGGSGNVSVSADGACSWQGSTTASWIQIASQPQNGNGNLAFTVQPNSSRAVRSAQINVGTHIITVNQAGVRTTPFDFNGDSRTDVSVYRPSTGTWWIAASGGGTSASQFGIATDRLAPADYDGDLKTDLAVFRDGTWYFVRSSDGTIGIITWGTTGDVPVPADFNSDGSAELAIYRPSTGVWWVLNSNGTYSAIAFGLSADVPTPGDYDGDGRADLSVYRGGTSGTWWIFNSSNGAVIQHAFGVQGDIPVAADYDGDGRDNVAVFRPSNGTWYRSVNAATNYDAVQWGIASDRPVVGDYDGDGRADPAVFRNGIWYMLGSTSGPQGVQFGTAGDHAVPSAFVP